MNTLEILRDLIQIDTRNPPGNEARAVDYIEALCRRVGLDYETYAFGEDRANIIVRLAPACDDRLVILGHLDVVGADEEAWDYEPFGAEIADGYLYGRGTLDMKYFVATALSVLAALKPEEPTLERGITCVFTADEENGSEYGLPPLLEIDSVRSELSGRTVLNEGGGFAYEHAGRWYSLVETGQKSVCRLTVSVPELPGSNPYFPTLDHEQILTRAIRAVEGARLRPAVPETARRLLARFPDGHDEFLSSLLYAMTHSMITPTVVHGGSRNPALPAGTKASALFDCRLLPGITQDELVHAVKEALGDLPVELVVTSFSAGYETEFSNPVMEQAEAALRRHDPRIEACVPFLTPGANDGKYLRPLGCDVLGFAPLATSQPFREVISLIHGVNERVSLESVAFCTDVMTDICRAFVEGRDAHVQR